MFCFWVKNRQISQKNSCQPPAGLDFLGEFWVFCLKTLSSPKRCLKTSWLCNLVALCSNGPPLVFARTPPSKILRHLLCDVSCWIVATFYPTNLGHSPNPSLHAWNISPSLLFFLEVHRHSIIPSLELCYCKRLLEWFRASTLKNC